MATKYFPSESGSSNCRGILTYTTSQTATQFTLNTSAVLQVNGVYGSGYNCILKVNNTTEKDVTGYKDPPAVAGWTTFLETGNVSKTYNRTSSDQTVTIAVSFAGKNAGGWYAGSGSGSTSVTITVPKLEQPTVTQALGSKTGSTAMITWSSNMTIDHVWYSSNNGSSWTDAGAVNSSSGSYTITGLAANTSYNIKTRVRGKASQLTSDSSALSVTTYAAPTISQSLASKTDTTIKISWTSGSTCDYLWYSTNGGSSWTAIGSINASSGTYTISGLSADTSYSIKTRVRGKDSQLTKDSSALSVTTYGYPTISQSVSSKTASSITIAWSSNSICDYLWYSTNGGSSWSGIDITDGTSGNYTISGLSADTSYNIITRVRRKDSQYTRDSSALSVTTYGYPTVSQLAADVTETTITIWWESDSVCDYVWYSTNGGSSWSAVGSANAKSGSFTISGLSANTSYSVNTRLRRKDSQLTANGTAFSVKTYDYPHPTSMPNFTIGNSLKVTIYNPLKRTVTVTFIAADGSTKSAGTVSGITVEGFNAAAWKTFLYASIPSAKSGTYTIKVTYGSVNRTNTGGTYTINTSECTPTIGSLTYFDYDPDTTIVTLNDQLIVQNLSWVYYEANDLSAKNSATVSSVSLSVNGNIYNMTIYNGTQAGGGNARINSASNVTATATITDSRGLTGTKSVTVQMLAWSLPSAIITLSRQSNYYTASYVKVDAIYSSVNSKNTITITYTGSAVPRSGMTTPSSVSGSLSDNVQITLNLDNEFDWNFTFTLTDKFGTTTYNRTLARGTPIIFFDDRLNSVGINKFPYHPNSLEFDKAYLGSDDLSQITVMPNYKASVSGAGWYRVYKYKTSSESRARGAFAFSVDLTFATAYNTVKPLIRKITLVGLYDRLFFVNETSGTISTNILSGVRYTTDASGNGYIDFYYGSSSANPVYCDAVIHPISIGSIETVDFTSVASSPSGETVQAEYSFNSNYNEYDDRYYKAGDTATISPRLILQGLVHNSAKEMTFEIVLPKSIDNISTITITALKGAAHGIGGVIDSSSSTKDWTSGYTLAAAKRIGNLAILDIQKTSAFSNATTNTPCVLYSNGITLSFS